MQEAPTGVVGQQEVGEEGEEGRGRGRKEGMRREGEERRGGYESKSLGTHCSAPLYKMPVLFGKLTGNIT